MGCCCSLLFPDEGAGQGDANADALNEPEFINDDVPERDSAPLLGPPPPKPKQISDSSASSNVDQETIREMLEQVSDE
jgi:hypothetical protein